MKVTDSQTTKIDSDKVYGWFRLASNKEDNLHNDCDLSKACASGGSDFVVCF